jgi:nitrite reductase/ring-hydroxylating ferredoxin subunit
MMRHTRKLSRRDFLRVAATAGIGALIAACAPATPKVAEVVEEAPAEQVATEAPTEERSARTATPTVETAPPTATPTVEEVAGTFIAKVADVPPGTASDFTYQGKPAIVVNFEGEYKAYRNVCPHNGCPTKYLGGDSLSCPCHGSSFKVETGDVIQGPATSPLRSIEVVVEDDGIYYVA